MNIRIETNGLDFCATPDTLGVTDDEVRALKQGVLPKARVDSIFETAHRAAMTLNASEASGRC